MPLVNDRPCGYPANAYYDFDFRASKKTANWTKTPARRIVYRTLHRLSPGGVDQLKVPALPRVAATPVHCDSRGLCHSDGRRGDPPRLLGATPLSPTNPRCERFALSRTEAPAR